jgi:hypothetical protein
MDELFRIEFLGNVENEDPALSLLGGCANLYKQFSSATPRLI